MHPRIRSAALHQHMVAVVRPCVCERGLNDGSTVPAAAQVGMGDDIVQETVAPSTAQEVRCRHEHAGCRDAAVVVGYENVDVRLRQDLLPNLLRPLSWLNGEADLGRGEQRQERRQIGCMSEPGDRHRRRSSASRHWPARRRRRCARRRAIGSSQARPASARAHGRIKSRNYAPASRSLCPGSVTVSISALRLLPCGSIASDRVTPPPSAFSMTKFSARSCGSS
jgi:hypothetical protein